MIAAAREAMVKKGHSPDAIIRGAKEKYGLDLTPADLGIGSPTNLTVPGPQSAIDPRSILAALFA